MSDDSLRNRDLGRVTEFIGKMSADKQGTHIDTVLRLKTVQTVEQYYNQHAKRLTEENEIVRDCGLTRDDVEFLLDVWIAVRLSKVSFERDDVDNLEQVCEAIDWAVNRQFHASMTDISEFAEGVEMQNAYLGFFIAPEQTKDTWVRHVTDPLKRFYLAPAKMIVFRPLYHARTDGVARDDLLPLVTEYKKWSEKAKKVFSPAVSNTNTVVRRNGLEIEGSESQTIYTLTKRVK